MFRRLVIALRFLFTSHPDDTPTSTALRARAERAEVDLELARRDVSALTAERDSLKLQVEFAAEVNTANLKFIESFTRAHQATAAKAERGASDE